MNRFKTEIVRHGAGGIEVPGHEGTWYVTGKVELSDFVLLLVESEQHGEDAASLIITKNPDGGIFLVLDDCFDGFDSLLDWYESKEELEAVLVVLMSNGREVAK
jgi:hypothetical protein